MSYPILYESTETDFSHGGFGFLSDCLQCDVTEEANGSFELVARYPMDGIHFENVNSGCILKVRLDSYRDPQLFRIYSIKKTMPNSVAIKARHISYDLSGIPVVPFSAKNPKEAMEGLKNNAIVDCPFTFWTDKENEADFKVENPSSIRSNLGGSSGSVLGVFGGEYEFDNFTVRLYNNRGEDRGFSVWYSKNLLSVKQEETISSVVTGIYPYWMDFDTEKIVEVPGRIVMGAGTFGSQMIVPVDFSHLFEEEPTPEQLMSAVEEYLVKNTIGQPNFSITFSFAQIHQSKEFQDVNISQRVSLFDLVSVHFPRFKISTKGKVVKIVYDVLMDRIKSATAGSIQKTIADTVANIQIYQNKGAFIG